ncbi:MAG TPA: NusG domain II-containing protein [Clostridia bacterium]|nr:NusG domain II-containing protein [Clostridia bacterium]
MRHGLDELKKQKYFYPADIIIYALIVIIAITLLAIFIIPNTEKGLEKIEVYYDSEIVYEYSFADRKGVIVSGHSYLNEYTENGLTYIEIKTKDGANILEIGYTYVKMIEADCSIFADCVNNFRPIEQGGDIIICLPNKIKVIGEGAAIGNGVRL